MTRRSSVGRVTAGILLALAIWATPAMSMSNGRPVTPVPPWAAYITTASGTIPGLNLLQVSEPLCTGTIVGAQWVLTAAHCVVTETTGGRSTSTLRPISQFRVVLGRSDLTNTFQGGQWTVDSVSVFPSWNPAATQGDLALLHLKGALPAAARPLPLAPSAYALADGAALDSYGYGDTSETYPLGAVANSYSAGGRTSVLRLTQLGSYTQSSACTTASDWCMHLVGSSEILHGDSGGPWVVDDDNPYIVGVTSFATGFQAGPRQTGVYHYEDAARVTAPAMHAWVQATAGLVNGAAGTIYRNPVTQAAWLMGADGFLRSIPDGGTYLCLTGRGHQVINLDAFTLAELPRASGSASCSNTQGNVLLYGDGDVGEDATGFTNISQALTSRGFNVTTMAGQTTLPADLSSYQQIWHYGIDVPSAADQQALIAFAKAGGGLFLTGERPCCELENEADGAIINALVLTVGGITVGGLGDIGSCGAAEAVNAGAKDGVASNPNVLTTWKPQCPGGLGNVAPANVFASSDSGIPVGALWDSADVAGGGRVVILMDVNWAQTTFGDLTTMGPVAQNLATFLAGG